MSLLRKHQQDFVERYFAKSTVRAAKNKSMLVKNFFVDTNNLTDGNMHYDRSIVFGESRLEPFEAASRATARHDSPIAIALNKAGMPYENHGTPLRVVKGNVFGTVWHHGHTYKSYWLGKPTSISHHADLTENEREAFLLQSRKLSAHGSIVFAVAYSEQATEPSKYSDVRSRIVGLLVFHPILFPGIEGTVAAMHSAGYKIIYASSDQEHDVQVFAHASCLAQNEIVPFVWRPGRELPLENTVYAALDILARKKLLAAYSTQTRIIVDEPLPQFWKQFTSLLK